MLRISIPAAFIIEGNISDALYWNLWNNMFLCNNVTHLFSLNSFIFYGSCISMFCLLRAWRYACWVASHVVPLYVTLWTAAQQAPLSTDFLGRNTDWVVISFSNYLYKNMQFSFNKMYLHYHDIIWNIYVFLLFLGPSQSPTSCDATERRCCAFPSFV